MHRKDAEKPVRRLLKERQACNQILSKEKSVEKSRCGKHTGPN